MNKSHSCFFHLIHNLIHVCLRIKINNQNLNFIRYQRRYCQMKPFGRKIHWSTKALSNKNYINEVSIDGKKTNRFNFRLGFYELYIGQVMRVGNCLTLLSTPPVFSLQIFKSTNLFDDAAKYIFWTFNATYLHTLEKYFSTLSSEELKDTLSILQTNPESYVHVDGNEADE